MAPQQNFGLTESLSDRIRAVSNLAYIAFAILFAGGLYVDWQAPGTVLVPFLSVMEQPYSNSGLFLLGIVFVVLGYVLSKAADIIVELNKEEYDQTQEWIVNIPGLDTDPGTQRDRM